MANTCVSPTITIHRYDAGGSLQEAYTQAPSQTREMNCRMMRVGGCWDATINVYRKIGEIGNLQLGDQIIISYNGTTLWRGWVDSYDSKDNDLVICCVGAWKALKSVYPDNARYGYEADSAEADEENEYSDIDTCGTIIQSLISTHLATSSITVDPDENNVVDDGITVYVADFDGNTDLLTICADLAMRAGNWSVGVDEDLVFYFTNPPGAWLLDEEGEPIEELQSPYDSVDFKACHVSAYQITDMAQMDSAAWSDTPTSVVIKGAGGYEETFDRDWLGYDKIQIAGITIINQQVITLPHIGPTEESTYTTQHTGTTMGDVVSVDAARYVDEFFFKLNKLRFRLECQNLNQRVYPWTEYAKVWDVDNSYRGEFVIDMVEYESTDNNISIKAMEISEL